MHHELTCTGLLRWFQSDTLSVEAYARSLLSHIEARDSKIKAWTYLDRESVLNQARTLDQIPRDQRGPLHGVAIGVKDMICTEGMPTQFGSPIYWGYESGFDASAVAILRAAGALILGKTTTTEFSVANSGPQTTNPHSPTRTPGGSSCGSAAAVADQQVPLSLGVQTGGSIIRPASFNGVFAFKPTHNAISLTGTKIISTSFDTLGFFARSIEDLQLVADVFNIQDNEPLDSIPLQDCSVAFIKTPMWSQAGPGTVNAMEKAAEILRNNGVTVEEIALPAEETSDLSVLKLIQKIIIAGEARSSLLKEYQTYGTRLDPEIRSLVESGTRYTPHETCDAHVRWASMRNAVDGLAAKYSVIITPSAIDEAPLGLSDMGRPTFNTLWTGLHMPVVNVPAFVGLHGMPVGISLVAGRYRDQHLLRIARILSKPLMAQGGWNPDKKSRTSRAHRNIGLHLGP